MLEPLNEVAGPKWTLSVMNNSPREIDACFANWWQAPDGARSLVLANFRPVEQIVHVDVKSVVLLPLNAVELPCN